MTADLNSTGVDDGQARLDWLIRLRGLALLGVAGGAALSAMGAVPGANRWVLGIAIVVGVLFNAYLTHRNRSRGELDERHTLQALLDTGALTIVLWGAGGAECPFMGFYVFPLLLAALLGGGHSLWPTAVAVGAGIAFQFAAVMVPWLRVGRWDPPATWGPSLSAAALTFTVAMVAYFAVRFTRALRHQTEARQQATALLRVAFEGLDAAVEVVESGRIVWQNQQASALLQTRAQAPWHCPGKNTACGGHTCDPLSQRATPCRFSVPSKMGPERIFEVLAFPLPQGRRFMALYVDRTREVLAERQLMVTERLASLGRAVSGVAHELNTPLATIQTLGRDVLDATQSADINDELRHDLSESADMIVSEVQRCRRITHALLGRAEKLDGRVTHEGCALEEALARAIAVVFTHSRDRVEVDIAPGANAHYPLDPMVQILVNLFQNASDAAPDAIQASAERQDATIVLMVRDHGPGLSPEAEQHLFEPFFTTKPAGQGTGLGLYTSYALARDLGGTLELSNHPDGGAVARLELPA